MAAELAAEKAEVAAEVAAELAAEKAEVAAEVAAKRAEVAAEVAADTAEVAAKRAELAEALISWAGYVRAAHDMKMARKDWRVKFPLFSSLLS
ncbi:MAG: hypothetical protein AAFQ10_12480 [Pseudomonadota bacterium]